MKAKTIGIGILAFLILIGFWVIGKGCWYAERTVQVIQQETDPVVLQQKYEWFKNALAQLDKKRADIQIYEGKIKAFESITDGNMDRTDKENFMIWQQEMLGVKASYNGLAAEYNAQMAKWNWRFTNRGDLPKGATETLPREVRKYVNE